MYMYVPVCVWVYVHSYFGIASIFIISFKCKWFFSIFKNSNLKIYLNLRSGDKGNKLFSYFTISASCLYLLNQRPDCQRLSIRVEVNLTFSSLKSPIRPLEIKSQMEFYWFGNGTRFSYLFKLKSTEENLWLGWSFSFQET